MQPSKAKILLVDDEPSILLTVAEILRLEGYEVRPVVDGASAIAAIREAHYDLVLTDLRMKGIDGLGVLAEVRKQSPNTVTVMMTGYASVDSATEALQLGAYDYLLKPVEVSALKLAVQRSLERKRLSEIDTLYHVSREISHAHNPADIEAEITSAAQQVLGVRNAYLITATREGQLQHEFSPLAPVLDDPQVLGRLNCGEIVTSRASTEDGTSGLPLSFVLVPGII